MNDDIELDYDFLMQNALRSMMRDVLEIIAKIGDAPGEHHFYIEFLTTAPGVSIPDHLLKDYPERMTIVLQHQFEELIVTEKGFAVTLWFKGKESRLEIPFEMVTSFADPSVQFGLRFEPAEEQAANTDTKAEEEPETNKDVEEETASSDDEKQSDGADIVSLDAFRKK